MGSYAPTQGTDREASFQLRNGVGVYGGFRGTETSRSERDWVANSTILSGDIGALGDASDNVYHVVTGSGLDGSAVLDGVTVQDGNADGLSPHDRGGGMYNDYSSPTISNVIFAGNSAGLGGGLYNSYSDRPLLMDVTFSDNTASDSGGGLFNFSSSPMVVRTQFTGNSAVDGGGMYNVSSQPTLANVVFDGNSASHWGGGMYNGKSGPVLINVALTANIAASGGGMANHWASPTLINVTTSGNSAESGGGLRNAFHSHPTIRNTIVWGNTSEQIVNDPDSSADVAFSDIQGGHDGTGNIDANPQFVAGTLRLRLSSPAVDAGDNTASLTDGEDLDGDGDVVEPLPFDLAGLPRFANVISRADTGNGQTPIIDMGAYETNPFFAALPLVTR